MNIGTRIKYRRKELGMSADKLAEILGKDRSTIYRYEKGDIENLPLDILEPIAQALGTTPAYLMGWEEDKKENTPEYTNLSEGEKMWLKIYHKLSNEAREILIESFDTFDELSEDQKQLAFELTRVAFQKKK